jgi:hypothetical protein
LPTLLLLELLEPLVSAEAGIGVSGLHKPPGVLLVQLHSLGLHIRSEGTVNIRTLVPVETQPVEGSVDVLHRLLLVAFPIRVLDPQDKLSALRPGEEVVEQGCSNASDVLKSRRRGSVSDPYLHDRGIIR